ncbi:MAG TPA: outer membrane beta-barrel protein [Steroidobacteraceae bacterium]|nr:outer membrane beta-barrel protein [Steroidobacteraceae bacterium]
MMRALAGTALLLLAGAATAADNGIYIGGSIGQANVEVEDDIADFDSDDTGFKVIAGIRPLDFLGFELNYVDLGAPEEGGVEVDATGIDAFAVGFLPLPLVDLFAKVGVVSWDSSVSVEGVEVVDDSGEDLAYGVGAQVRFGSIAVRAEYEIFDIDDTDDVNMLSLGLTWTFL